MLINWHLLALIKIYGGIKMNLEKIDQLRERANVSYEEAKEALEKCNDDMVEALIYLEKNQKIKAEPVKKAKCGHGIGSFIKRIIHKGNSIRLTIMKGEHSVLAIPLTFAIIFTLIAPHLALVGLILALVTSHRIQLVKKDGTGMEVNRVMDQVSNAVNTAKSKIMEQTTTKS